VLLLPVDVPVEQRPEQRGCGVVATATNRAISEQLLRRNVQRFRGGLVSKAHGLVYHSTLGLKVIKEEEVLLPVDVPVEQRPEQRGCRVVAAATTQGLYLVIYDSG